MLPTHLLTERASSPCALGEEDVDFLLAEHRAHIEVAPTREPGRYRLTPKGHVGTLVAPGCRLVIRPKIPLHNFCYLLDPTAPVPVVEDHAEAAPASELLELLAGRLARLMQERAASGLHRAYVEQAAHGPYLQGRLDVPAQMREAHGDRARVHCRYDDFTLDVPCNQFPRATAERVLRSALVGEGIRRALTAALRPFAGVRAVTLGSPRLTTAPPDRLTEAYRPLLDLCGLLADGLGPTDASGPTACPAFLIAMERVFENYCVRGLASAFAARANEGYTVAEQPLYRPARPADGPDLWMRPDFTLHRDGRPLVVVDAKWKRSPRVRADLYQLLGYCAALGFGRGVLVYPGRRDRAWDYDFAENGLRVRVLTLRVVGSRSACARSLGRLARRVRK